MKPHDNMAIVSAAARELTIRGKRYAVAKVTPRMFGRLQALVMDRYPDPRVKVRQLMEGLPDEVQKEMWRGAVIEAKSWPPRIGSSEGNSILMSPEGMDLFVHLVIGPSIGGFTVDDASKLVDDMTMDEFQALVALAMPGDPMRPKAPAETAEMATE